VWGSEEDGFGEVSPPASDSDREDWGDDFDSPLANKKLGAPAMAASRSFEGIEIGDDDDDEDDDEAPPLLSAAGGEPTGESALTPWTSSEDMRSPSKASRCRSFFFSRCTSLGPALVSDTRTTRHDTTRTAHDTRAIARHTRYLFPFAVFGGGLLEGGLLVAQQELHRLGLPFNATTL